jgi:hypothetical protein
VAQDGGNNSSKNGGVSHQVKPQFQWLNKSNKNAHVLLASHTTWSCRLRQMALLGPDLRHGLLGHGHGQNAQRGHHRKTWLGYFGNDGRDQATGLFCFKPVLCHLCGTRQSYCISCTHSLQCMLRICWQRSNTK